MDVDADAAVKEEQRQQRQRRHDRRLAGMDLLDGSREQHRAEDQDGCPLGAPNSQPPPPQLAGEESDEEAVRNKLEPQVCCSTLLGVSVIWESSTFDGLRTSHRAQCHHIVLQSDPFTSSTVHRSGINFTLDKL